MIEVTAIEPLEAVGLFNDRFADLGWTDGYPVWPPTADRVAELTDAVGGEVDEVLFRLPPGNGELTLRKLAVNCAMANCSPAEMAIVEAALRAFTDERQRTMVRACLMSTSAHAPVVVINGPLARSIGVNAGRSCVGPGVQNIVNLRIARAISLCLNNLGRWSSGVMDLDTIGTPRKHIVVIAENVEESPWPPFHEESGFAAEDDVVTVFFSMGEWDVGLQGHLDPAQLADSARCLQRWQQRQRIFHEPVRGLRQVADGQVDADGARARPRAERRRPVEAGSARHLVRHR